MNSLLNKQSCLDVFPLFFMIVLSRTWVYQVGRMGVRGLNSVDPEVFLSLGGAEEILIPLVRIIHSSGTCKL